jgi:hypothetical protein
MVVWWCHLFKLNPIYSIKMKQTQKNAIRGTQPLLAWTKKSWGPQKLEALGYGSACPPFGPALTLIPNKQHERKNMREFKAYGVDCWDTSVRLNR